MRAFSSERLKNSINILLLILVSFFFMLTGQAVAQLTAKANHSRIKIDFFYHGTTMSVRGIADPGVDLIIKLASADGHEVMKSKGKVGGVLWMNVGTLKIDHVPGVYFLHSTKKIEDILGAEEAEKHAIGYPALQKHIQMDPVSDEKERWFNEFVKFKEDSRLYSISTGKISVTEKNRQGNYYILTEWPYQVPPGTYTATVYAVKDKKVVESVQSNITVEQEGVVKTLAGMAKDSGATYGILSIVIALGVGFGVSMVFKKGGDAH
ncbi:MAG: TIGR02186 family protein [Thermodesulfobacteriota bacterium]